jgi:guanylate kinase
MRTSNDKKGRIVIVSGPSGVGKSSICREAAKRLNNVYLSISVTTRPIGKGEVDGRDYRFITRRDFQEKADKGMLLEYAEVFGHYYGTPREPVEQALKEDKTVILEIDSQGARQVKSRYQDAEMIFILPPSQKDLAERMNTRGRGQAEEPKERLDYAGSEIAAGWQYYEHMVINDNLEHAVGEVVDIIKNVQSQDNTR